MKYLKKILLFILLITSLNFAYANNSIQPKQRPSSNPMHVPVAKGRNVTYGSIKENTSKQNITNPTQVPVGKSNYQNLHKSSQYNNQSVDINIRNYHQDLTRKIRLNWHPPKNISNKKTKVFFTINRDGKLVSYKVLQSSGDKDYDNSAITAVTSTKFSPIPSNINKNTLDIQFTFDYNNNATSSN